VTHPNAEWIAINNDGELTWQLVGWEISDETPTQRRAHVYRFPIRIGNGVWQFEPGETIFVFTGVGADQFIASPSSGGRPQFHFFMNRRAMVWNNAGDRVYLRNADGTFVTQPFPVP
jgi:hypothetical protein